MRCASYSTFHKEIGLNLRSTIIIIITVIVTKNNPHVSRMCLIVKETSYPAKKGDNKHQ